MIKKLKKLPKLFWIILFCFLYLLIYKQVYTSSLIWYDEGYQIALNNHSLKEIIYFISKDLHVPLFTFLIKIFSLIPIPIINSSRLLLTVIVIAHFIIAFYPLERLTNRKIAFTYAFIFLFSPVIIYFGLEIRMYALTELNLFSYVIYFLLAIKKNRKKDWILTIIFSILNCYSHPLSSIITFFFFLVLIIYYYKKDKTITKKIGICLLITIISFLPWIKILLEQIKTVTNPNRHHEFPDNIIELIFSITSSLATANASYANEVGAILMTIIITQVVIYIIYYNKTSKCFKNPEQKNQYFLFLIIINVISFSTILSYTYLNQTFYPRYFTMFYSLLILTLIIYFNNKKVFPKIYIFITFSICFITNYNYIYTNQILVDNKSLKRLNQDIINNTDPNEEISIYHIQEITIGTFYVTYFQEYNHYITPNNTYSYPIPNDLITYKVFGNNINELNDIEEIKQYTQSFWLIIKEYDEKFKVLNILKEKNFNYSLINQYEYKYDKNTYNLYKVTSLQEEI